MVFMHNFITIKCCFKINLISLKSNVAFFNGKWIIFVVLQNFPLRPYGLITSENDGCGIVDEPRVERDNGNLELAIAKRHDKGHWIIIKWHLHFRVILLNFNLFFMNSNVILF